MNPATRQRRFRRCEYNSPRQAQFKPRRDDEPWASIFDTHAEECDFVGKNFDVPFSTILDKAKQEFPSIAMDKEVICGSPRIAGTRIPVYMVVDAVKYYGTLEGARKSYPQLTTEQIKDALAFAGFVLEQPIEYEPEALT